jgi:hypothetical protein
LAAQATWTLTSTYGCPPFETLKNGRLMLENTSRSPTLQAHMKHSTVPCHQATTLSTLDMMGNTSTASATSIGRRTARKFRSMCTVSYTCLNRRLLKIPWKQKVSTSLSAEARDRRLIRCLLQSANSPISSPKSKTSRPTSSSANEPTETPPRAQTQESSGGRYFNWAY